MKHFLLAILFSLAAIAPRAQVTAAKAFTAAPAEVMLVLGSSVRLDMLDYFHAGSPKKSANATAGNCWIVDEQPYSLTLNASDSTRYQIFVLNPTDEQPVLGVIETIAAPVRDSILRLYDYRWEPLDRQPFAEPPMRAWLVDTGKEAVAKAEEQLPFTLAEYSYDPDTEILTLSSTLDSYFAPSDRPEALDNIRPQLRYRWNGKNFKRLDK